MCGNVGSGKTSLISSILEQVWWLCLFCILTNRFRYDVMRCDWQYNNLFLQMHLLNGSVSANGTLAYVSQQAWIFHGTVRDNILMGEPFDQTRWKYKHQRLNGSKTSQNSYFFLSVSRVLFCSVNFTIQNMQCSCQSFTKPQSHICSYIMTFYRRPNANTKSIISIFIGQKRRD